MTAADARTRDTADAHATDLHALFVRAVDATGYAIARELGVSETILSRCYIGKRPPSLELLCDVAALAELRVTITTTKARGAADRCSFDELYGCGLDAYYLFDDEFAALLVKSLCYLPRDTADEILRRVFFIPF